MTKTPDFNLPVQRIPDPPADEHIRLQFRRGGAVKDLGSNGRRPPVVVQKSDAGSVTRVHATAPLSQAELNEVDKVIDTVVKTHTAKPRASESPKSFDMRLCVWCGGRLHTGDPDGIHERCTEARDRAQR